MAPPEASDPEVVDAYAKAAAQVEVKTATGPQLDMVTIMPMLNPRLMPVPVMIIHGQYDDVADLDGLLLFFAQLPKWARVPSGLHTQRLGTNAGRYGTPDPMTDAGLSSVQPDHPQVEAPTSANCSGCGAPSDQWPSADRRD